MPSTTGIRRRLPPALLAGAPYRVGDRMGERYQVKDAIGLGPLGFVFRAADEQQGIDVAVKMVHPRFVQTAEEREAFSRAVEPARKFMQPSLARVHDLGVDQGWPYITYSFLDGLTLRRMIDSRLAKGQTFTLEEVEPFLGQLAAALEAAHPLGAHADLKPENVVILPDMLRVVDWGVARGLPRLPFVQAQKQKSTHRYLAPEIVSGGEADPRADLYSLGVLVGEMLTGLTPDDDIPELRLTTPELPEAVEGFYRRALNERPEARFRSVRELYEEFVALLAPEPRPVEVVSGSRAEQTEAVVEELQPLEEAEVVAEGSSGASAPESAAMPPAAQEPIAAAALPRFDSPGPEQPRHTREVVALEPAAWTGSSPTAEAPAARPGSDRWRALRRWDENESGAGTSGSAPTEVPLPPSATVADHATGPELPVGAKPALALVRSPEAGSNGTGGLEHTEEEADRAVAELTEVGEQSGSESGSDEPLLAEALGVDLVIEGDEPVPEPMAADTNPGAGSAPGTPAAGAHPLPPAAKPRDISSVPIPVTPLRDAPPAAAASRATAESRPWATEPRPPAFHRETADASRTREAPAASRAPLPPPPTIPPLRATAPRLMPTEPVPPPPPAPTPVGLMSEPSPTRQEPIITPLATPEAIDAALHGGSGRGAGSWSPAELLAQVIAEIHAEERSAGIPQGTSWEPVPLDATQPISTEEVAARVAAAEARGLTTARRDDEDLPALRHEAGRAGMRMALLTAAGLIIGILGGWTLMKVLSKPARPQVERITQARPPEQPPGPRN
jgi:serine/threonine protein kinase